MADLDRVSQLVQRALDEFDDPNVTLSSTLRRCIRIASLRGDAAGLAWLTMETRDVADGTTKARRGLADQLLAELPQEDRGRLVRAETDGYMDRRSLGSDNPNIYAMSIQNIEDHVRNIREQEATMVAPEGMTPLDLGLRLIEIDKARPALLNTRLPLERILARTRQRLWEFLIETEWSLTFGEASAETFDRLRRYVDQQLTVLSPTALEQFQSAYRRLREGGAEARAQAVTSCRRVLKTLADLLYPAGEPAVGIDGKPHDMTDDKFINRIAQFVTEAVGSHANGSVVQAAVADIGMRVGALNELASKGLHAEIGEYEVDSCVVQTYLVVADLLRIRERTHTVANPSIVRLLS